MRKALLFCALAAALLAAPAMAQDVSVGVIDHLDKTGGDVTIVRGAQRLSAHTGSLLLNHDRVEITGRAYACILRAGSGDAQCQPKGVVAIEADAKPHAAGFADFIAALTASTGKALPSEGYARGGESADVPIQVNPLLPDTGPAAVQYVVSGYKLLSPVWVGAKADAALILDSRGQAPVSEDHSNVTHSDLVIGLQSPATATLQLSRPGHAAEIHWQVRVNDHPPAPPWLAGAAGELGATQRMERAVWLLHSDLVQWHLFALSELSQLARDGSFEAQLWLDFARSQGCADASATAQTCPFLAR